MAVDRNWNPGVAMVLSFFVPGLGQIYKGQLANGLCWMFLVFVGYLCLIVPGLILHLCCLIGAGSVPRGSRPAATAYLAMLASLVCLVSPARALDDAIPARLAALLNCDQRLDLLGYAYAGCIDEAELVREAGYKVHLTRYEDALRPAKLDEFVASAEFTVNEIDRRLGACRQTETQRFMVVLDCRARVALPKALMLREIVAGRGVRKPGRR